jgi:glutamine amidotransferase
VIAIVDIGMGNLHSVANAVDAMGYDPVLVRQPDELQKATHCILPGVGSFRVASERLSITGFCNAIREFAARERPVLGICLGMQLLSDCGEEGGESPGLGLIAGRVKKLVVDKKVRLPHVGWNTVSLRRDHPVWKGVKSQRDFYFVHSYAFTSDISETILGETDHGTSFTSVVAKDHILGFQFHPEKSQANGLKLIENFCKWNGKDIRC